MDEDLSSENVSLAELAEMEDSHDNLQDMEDISLEDQPSSDESIEIEVDIVDDDGEIDPLAGEGGANHSDDDDDDGEMDDDPMEEEEEE